MNLFREVVAVYMLGEAKPVKGCQALWRDQAQDWIKVERMAFGYLNYPRPLIIVTKELT